MNRFNSPIVLLVLIGTWGGESPAQTKNPNKQVLKTTVHNISQLAEEIGLEVANAVQQIDVEAIQRDVEQLAELSIEQLGDADLTGFQKEKVIEKVYSIKSNHRIAIDNAYGKVAIQNWNRPEVKAVITIRTAESSERRAEEALSRVRIDASQSGNTVSFKTHISSNESSWWSSLTSGSSDRALRVDYQVYLPRTNELIVANRYGAIELDDRDGKVTLAVDYGSLNAGRLNAKENALNVAYSKAELAYINGGDVSVKYGGFNLAEAETLHLTLSYSGGSNVGQINQEADINLQYSGGFQLGLGNTIQKANVSASYSNITIKPVVNAAFNFNVAVSYGGFDYDHNRTNIQSKSGSNTSKSYTGYWNKTVSNFVNISSQYGTVRLK